MTGSGAAGFGEVVRRRDHRALVREPVVVRSQTQGRTRDANERFISSVRDRCLLRQPGDALKKPFDLYNRAPLPALIRVYTYGLTTHPSERQLGAYRIQITLPAAAKGHFDWAGDAYVVLAGYEADLDVFALWDADAHDAGGPIPQSKGVQVHENTLLRALNHGIGTQERSLRPRALGIETIVVARPDHLYDALVLRWQLYIDRITT